MDLLDLLVQDTHEQAGQRLAVALSRATPSVEKVNFNVVEVVLDREENEARIFDVLDGNSEPMVVTLDELRRRSTCRDRLGQALVGEARLCAAIDP